MTPELHLMKVITSVYGSDRGCIFQCGLEHMNNA